MLFIPLQTLTSFAAACQPKMLTFIPTWYKYLEGQEVNGHCEIAQVGPEDIGSILLALVDMLLTLGGIIAIGFVIYGGIQYVLSQGEPDKIKGAQKTVLNAVIGLVIALLATGIVSFIGGKLITSTTAPAAQSAPTTDTQTDSTVPASDEYQGLGSGGAQRIQ